LLAALAAGSSVQAAAKVAGVSESTVYRRMRGARFKKRLQRLRAAMVDRSLGHLSKGSAEAAITLRKLLKSDDGRTRLGAAKAIIELGIKVRQMAELAAEVEELKAAVAAMKGRKRL
jgi:hypothetical protein